MVWRLGRPRAKFQQAPHLIQRLHVLTCGRGEGGPWGLSYKALIPHHAHGPCLQRPSDRATWTDFLEGCFSTDWEGDDFGMVQVHYIYCALHFYCYYISPASDLRHQILEVGSPDIRD